MKVRQGDTVVVIAGNDKGKTGTVKSVIREKDRVVKDVAIDKLGRGLLGSIERKGQMGHLPIPGRLRIYQSLDLLKWAEMDVDYKAVANSVALATGDAQARFAATDTGMILKYE